MRIENNLLVDDPRIKPFVPATRGWIKSITIRPEFLAYHYTATTSLADALASKWAVHFYIDWDGSIIQKVPLDKYACHAGVSEWGGRVNLNAFAHGIEIVNYGFLYRDWKGRYYRDGKYIAAENVMEKPHRLEKKYKYWQIFTPAALQSVKDVSECMHNHYHYIDAVGHEDVCAKVDPGPAFPAEVFREYLYGLEENARYIVSRWWSGNDIGAGGVSLKWQPWDWSPSIVWCPAGTVVRKLEWNGRWVKVERDDGRKGWIREKYLRRIV
jgi:N-acetylmuramoyl-L-alanine amidase